MQFKTSRRVFMFGTSAIVSTSAWPAWAIRSENIEPQPYFESVKRAIEALATAGQPVDEAHADQLAKLAVRSDVAAIAAAEAILNSYTLALVTLDDEGMGTATLGGAERMLIEQGWKSFLVRVSNPAGISEKFDVSSGSGAGRISRPNNEQKANLPDTLFQAPLIEKRWWTAQARASQPLSGAVVEYKVIDLYSRDRGLRSGKLGFGAGNIEIGGRSVSRANWVAWKNPLVFNANARPTDNVTLSILDGDGIGCMASLIVKDKSGHVYPPQVMRLAPDMAFHPQVYRADGETLRLPDGEYTVAYSRGPEYFSGQTRAVISHGNRFINVSLKRWIDPAEWGWYSGDTHIHSAGCSHYVHPTEGVSPETIIRHVRGEALSIGSALNWGPSWYYQKQFFTAAAVSPEAILEHPELQEANNATWRPKPTPKDKESLLRYDVEVSGFPSSMMGHLVLLRLNTQDYPGTKSIEDWPSWNLPIYKWVRQQGGVAGVAHCSAGMKTSSAELPNYEIPPMDSVGTNEAIVDVTHGYCDFLSGCESEPASEFNAWYHMLNCGFRLAMVGETDFPCFTDERIGMGRSYVQLESQPTDEDGYYNWIQGIKAGRLYCGDGRTHFLKYAINGVELGAKDVQLASSRTVSIEALVAARLEPEVIDDDQRYQWHLERARIGRTRSVPLELVVNGRPVERVEFLADGKPRPVRFKTRIERSSWVALRVMPSGHTHPIFVTVESRPIRGSRRSAEWLRQCVDVLWREKHRLIRENERSAATDAYEHARRTYDRIIAESDIA